MSGHLEVIIGPMFSGKSSCLIGKIKKYKLLGKKIIVINHEKDTRYGTNKIITHDRTEYDAICLKNLSSIYNFDEFKDLDVIFIEEAQFFDDLYDFVKDCVDNHNKHVIVAGLDGDYRREPFTQVVNLIPLAEDIIKLKALCLYCNDGTEACFTKRLVNDDRRILVGTDVEHIPLCRKHYLS